MMQMCVTHGIEYDDELGCAQCIADVRSEVATRVEVAPDNPEALYYLQDARGSGVVGNCLLWWRKEHRGYTTDLGDAHVFTASEVSKYSRDTKTDVPWPKEYVDERAERHLDHQVTNHRAAVVEDLNKYGCPWGHHFGHEHDLCPECKICPNKKYTDCAHRHVDTH